VAVDIVIYHNPECGTSRNTLGDDPQCRHRAACGRISENPARTRAAGRADRPRRHDAARDLLREKGTPYAELGLGDTSLSDDALVDAMMAHPILINRPLVVSPLGVKLCRPSEAVLDLLPNEQLGAFAKEDGEQVVDASGQRVA
jgi:arsenate reductase (glutaredoxin)